MRQFRVLDAFCCAGGATRGFQLAGDKVHVTGVDIVQWPDYCGDEFEQGDAVAFIRRWGRHFDLIHSSPPCQAHSNLTKGNKKRAKKIDKAFEHKDLIPATRAALKETGRPYIIENVQGSTVRKDLTLCGLQFGLRVFRHRHFEISGFEIPVIAHVSHKGHRVAGWRHGVRYDGDMLAVYGDGGGKGSVEEWREAMGIDWTWNKLAIAQAIPPAYTKFLGTAALASINAGP